MGRSRGFFSERKSGVMGKVEVHRKGMSVGSDGNHWAAMEKEGILW